METVNTSPSDASGGMPNCELVSLIKAYYERTM